MSSHSQSDMQHMRQVAQQILEQIQKDPVYRQQVQDSPVDTLLMAGLSERMLPDFMREMDLTADVVGYDFTNSDICSTTCIITCITTELGDKGLPGHHDDRRKPL